MKACFPIACILAHILVPLPAAAQPHTEHVNSCGDPIPDGAAVRLGTQQFRHGHVEYLAVEKDGKAFVTIAINGHVHRWDLATGKFLGIRELPQYFEGHGGYSPDGKTLVLSRGDGVQIWDVESKRKRHQVRPSDNTRVTKFTIAGDGKTVACHEQANQLNMPSSVFLLDAFSAERKGTVALQKPFRDLVAAPDGKRVFIAAEGSLGCWDDTGKMIWSRAVEVYRVVIDPTGKSLLVYGKPDNVPIRRCNSDTGKDLGKLSVNLGGFWTGVAFTRDGKTAAFNTQRNVEIWDLVADKLTHQFPGAAHCVAFSPDDKTLVTCQGVIQAFDVASGKPKYPDSREWGQSHHVDRMIWSPDSKHLATGSRSDPSLFVWDAAAGKRVCRTTGSDIGWGMLSFAFANGGKELIGAGPLYDIWLWDSATGKTKSKTMLVQDGKPVLLSMPMFTRDGTRWVDHDQGVWTPEKQASTGREMPSGKIFQMFSLKPGKLHAGFTPDSVVSIDYQGRTRDLMSGKLSPHLQVPEGLTVSPMHSSDGFLTAGRLVPVPDVGPGLRVYQTPATVVGVWERATGRLLRKWDFKNKQLSAMTVISNNRTLALVFGDEAHFRDLASGTADRKLKTGAVHHLTISPDSRWLATSRDCTILLWDLRETRRPAKALLAVTEIERLWKELGDPEPSRALPAVWKLIDAGDQALAVLRKRMLAVPHPPKGEMAALLQNLESDIFKVRDAAFRRLSELGEQAEPALQVRLRARPSLERRRRIESLLEPLLEARPPEPETLRAIRAVQTAERIGTASAIRLLEDWTLGAEGAPLTREASAAVARRKFQERQ